MNCTPLDQQPPYIYYIIVSTEIVYIFLQILASFVLLMPNDCTTFLKIKWQEKERNICLWEWLFCPRLAYLTLIFKIMANIFFVVLQLKLK